MRQKRRIIPLFADLTLRFSFIFNIVSTLGFRFIDAYETLGAGSKSVATKSQDTRVGEGSIYFFLSCLCLGTFVAKNGFSSGLLVPVS